MDRDTSRDAVCLNRTDFQKDINEAFRARVIEIIAKGVATFVWLLLIIAIAMLMFG